MGLRNNPKLAVRLVEALQQIGSIDTARASQLIPPSASNATLTPIATIPIHSQDINTPVGNFAPTVPNEPIASQNGFGYGGGPVQQPNMPEYGIDEIRRQLEGLPTEKL